MLLSWFQTGLTWYYFNVIAIAYIIYMLLKIGLARAQRASLNQSESASKEDRFTLRLIVYTSIFAIVYFMMREYSKEVINALNSFIEWIRGLYGN